MMMPTYETARDLVTLLAAGVIIWSLVAVASGLLVGRAIALMGRDDDRDGVSPGRYFDVDGFLADVIVARPVAGVPSEVDVCRARAGARR